MIVKPQSTRHNLRMLIILSGLVCCLGVFTLARFIMKKNEAGVLTTQQFYFTSNFLKDTSDKAEYFIDPNKATIELEIRNYADTKRKTTVDIECSIEITHGTADISNFVLSSTASAKQIQITPDAGTAEFTVTAISTKPYKKKLTAVFKRVMGNTYRIEDSAGNHAASLIMTCSDGGKDIPLQLPADILPDAGDDRLNKNSSGEYVFSSPGEGIYSITLLKTNPVLDLTASGSFADHIKITE